MTRPVYLQERCTILNWERTDLPGRSHRVEILTRFGKVELPIQITSDLERTAREAEEIVLTIGPIGAEHRAFVCPHCNGNVSDSAHVVDQQLFHTTCLEPWRQKLAGRAYRCPVCSGIGRVTDRNNVVSYRITRSTDEAAIDAGYNGAMGPSHMPLEYGTKRCDLCEGHGYLEKEPKQKMQVVGWERG